MLTVFTLSFFIGLVAKHVVRKLKKKQATRLPHAGGSSALDLELYNDNDLGHIILSCIADEDRYLVRDPKLNELIFAPIRAKIRNESLIINPNLIRFIALRLIKPNTGIIARIGNLVISPHKTKTIVQTIIAVALGLTNSFLMSLPYIGLSMVLIITSTRNCYPCERYFEKLTPGPQEEITRAYSNRPFGNIVVSNNDESHQVALYVPSSAAETKEDIIGPNEVKRTMTYRKSRPKARRVTFEDFRRNDNELKAFNNLEEPTVKQTPCLSEIIEAILEAGEPL